MPPYQPPKRTSCGGVPYPPVWIISFPSCCGRHPVYVLARAVWRYGILPPLFCFQMKNTLCTSCFHSLRVVLDTKCCTAPALSCTRIPMRRASLPACRMLPIAFHGWKANSVAGEHTAMEISLFYPNNNSHFPLKRYDSNSSSCAVTLQRYSPLLLRYLH